MLSSHSSSYTTGADSIPLVPASEHHTTTAHTGASGNSLLANNPAGAAYPSAGMNSGGGSGKSGRKPKSYPAEIEDGLTSPAAALDSIASAFSSPSSTNSHAGGYSAGTATAYAAQFQQQSQHSVSSSSSSASGDRRYDTFGSLSRSSDGSRVADWLVENQFDAAVVAKLSGYNGVDLLSLSKDDLRALIGTKDGIRLYNRLKQVREALTALGGHADADAAEHHRVASAAARLMPAASVTNGDDDDGHSGSSRFNNNGSYNGGSAIPEGSAAAPAWARALGARESINSSSGGGSNARGHFAGETQRAKALGRCEVMRCQARAIARCSYVANTTCHICHSVVH